MSSKSGDAGAKARLCFVVGPIGKDGSIERKHSDLLLNAVIKHALQNADFAYAVKRADEDADPGMIGDRVVSDIINADLVVADLTDLNPNAFYELGIRHSTQKPTIHVAKIGTALPFDNVSHRTIFVDLTDWHSIEQARDRVASSARAIEAPGYKVSNPITQANATFTMRQSADPRDQIIAEMQERMATLENVVGVDYADGIENWNEVAEYIGMHIKDNKKIQAIAAYKDITNSGLSDAKDLVESIISGKRTDAIVAHRTVTGVSLKDAREFVDNIAKIL